MARLLRPRRHVYGRVQPIRLLETVQELSKAVVNFLGTARIRLVSRRKLMRRAGNDSAPGRGLLQDERVVHLAVARFLQSAPAP